MARSRDFKSIRYDSAIDGHCAACSSSNLRQASSNRRSMSRGWLAERTGTTRPRRRRRAVRHMPYLPHRTHQLALRARRGSQQERHRLSAGPQRKPSSSFFSRDARQCVRTATCSVVLSWSCVSDVHLSVGRLRSMLGLCCLCTVACLCSCDKGAEFVATDIS